MYAFEQDKRTQLTAGEYSGTFSISFILGVVAMLNTSLIIPLAVLVPVLFLQYGSNNLAFPRKSIEYTGLAMLFFMLGAFLPEIGSLLGYGYFRTITDSFSFSAGIAGHNDTLLGLFSLLIYVSMMIAFLVICLGIAYKIANLIVRPLFKKGALPMTIIAMIAVLLGFGVLNTGNMFSMLSLFIVPIVILLSVYVVFKMSVEKEELESLEF